MRCLASGASRETRERIEAAVVVLGFTLNAGARALAAAQTMVVGLFVQFFEDEFSPAMRLAVQALVQRMVNPQAARAPG